MIIEKPDGTYGDDTGATYADWRQTRQTVAADGLEGRIVKIYADVAGRLDVVEMHWMGPPVARVHVLSLWRNFLYYGPLRRGDRLTIGPFRVVVLNYGHDDDVLVRRYGGRAGDLLLLVTYRAGRWARAHNRRLLAMAKVWNLIDKESPREPKWSQLRPYRWLVQRLAW